MKYIKKTICFYGTAVETKGKYIYFDAKVPYLRGGEKWALKVLHSPRLQKKYKLNFIPSSFRIIDEDNEEKRRK